MANWKSFFRESGIVVATTIGAGIFALPYVFARAGWLVSTFYLAGLGVVIVTAHVLYWKVLDKVKEKERLLGLARAYLGRFGYFLGLTSVILGLTLVLTAHLILGNQFIGLALPFFYGPIGLFLFWFLSSLPLLLKEKRVLSLEVLGIMPTVAIIVFIFFSSLPGGLLRAPVINFQSNFLPFGIILFALAGWPAIEPIYASRKSRGLTGTPVATLALGTVAAALLYLMFVSGILSFGAGPAPDTVSGLVGWPLWKKSVLGVLGLIALWTSYLPIGLEIKNSLVFDLRRSGTFSLIFVIFAPLILVLAGLNSFLKVLGLAGGVFLSLQYLLIVMLAKKILELSAVKKFFLDLIMAVFILAAVYEIYYFVIQ